MSKKNLLVSCLFSLFITASVNAQWFQQMSGTIAPLSSIHCINDSTCMVVGTVTTSRKTTDGTTWNVTGGTGITSKSFVRMYNKDTISLGQVNCSFRRSLDGGATWSPGEFGGNLNFGLNDVAFISATNWTGVGGSASNHATGGHITTSTTNSGQSWPNYVNVAGEPTFFGIHALTTTTFVACGGAASVYKTTNGGANWTAKSTGTATVTYYDISWAPNDPLIGYVVGGSSSTVTPTGGIVLRTTDGGETWSNPGNAGLLPNAIYGVHFVDQVTGYVVGDGGNIQVTQDGGQNWTKQISPVTTTLNKIHFPTTTTGYICGLGGVILKTSNGGFVAPLVANAGADASVCVGSCTTLNAGATSAATGGTIPYTYLWSSGQTTSSIVVCSSATGTYTMTVTDANSISATDSAKVTAYVNPSVSFSGLSTNYCGAVTADVLTGTPTGGVFTGPGVTAGIFNAAAAGSGTHTVTYTFTSTNGCVITSSQTTTVANGPLATLLCMVTVDTITPPTHMVDTANKIIWTKPVSTDIVSFKIYRSYSAAPTFTPIATVSYSANPVYVDHGISVDPKLNPYFYKISSVDSCGGESALSDTASTVHLQVTAYSLPSKFDLSWTRYNGFSFAAYEIWRTTDSGATWKKINSVASAVPSLTYSDGGAANPAPNDSRYRIHVTYATGCPTGVSTYTYSVSNVTLNLTAVNEIGINNLLKVYPNPNHGTFKMELEGVGIEVFQTIVYDMLGHVVYQSAEKLSEISIPGLKRGIYHLEVVTDSGNAHKKFAVE